MPLLAHRGIGIALRTGRPCDEGSRWFKSTSLHQPDRLLHRSPETRYKLAEAVKRYTHKFNPICRRFLSGSALGAKFEVVVRVVSALEVTLRHHRVAFRAKMFVRDRCSPSELIAVAGSAHAR